MNSTMDQSTYDMYRTQLAERDLSILNDPYFNTIPAKIQTMIEVRHMNYILECEDDEATKVEVTKLSKTKKPKRIMGVSCLD